MIPSQEPLAKSLSDTLQKTTALVMSNLDKPPTETKGPPVLKSEEPGIYPSLLDLESELIHSTPSAYPAESAREGPEHPSPRSYSV